MEMIARDHMYTLGTNREEPNSFHLCTEGYQNCEISKHLLSLRSGLAERLQHIISREKSEKAFWSHRIMETEKEHKGLFSSADGDIIDTNIGIRAS